MKPLIQLTLFYIIGVVCGYYIDISFPIIYTLGVYSFILSLLFFIKKLPRLTNIFLLLSIIVSGMLFHELHSRFLYPSNSLTKYLDKKVILIGDITRPVEISEDKISLIIRANTVIDDKVARRVNELVLVNIEKNNYIAPDVFEYGDRIKVRGELKMPSGLRNPGGFDYKKYLAKEKIFVIVWIQDEKNITRLGTGKFNPIFMFAYKIRDKASSIIVNILPNEPLPCASFLEGVLLGKRSMLPEEVMRWFEDTGTIHILAISGLHVGLIGLIFFFIFHKMIQLPQKPSLMLTLLVLIIFAIMTGAAPSVVRATIMASAIIVGMMISRDTDIYNNLALAALIILLQNPLTLFDIGFQLSFVAVLSLVYLSPFIEPKLWFLPKYLAKLISASIAVQIGISPILIFYFNKLSLITVLANIIVIPLLGVILVLGLSMIFTGIIIMSVSKLIGIINSYIITYLLTSVHLFSQVPYAYIYLPTLSLFAIGSYYFCLWGLTKHKKLGTSKVIIGILLLINIFLWKEVIKTSSGIMKVTFLDVGQGDAIFLEFPKGGNMMIDGGNADEYFDAGKQIILPFLRHKGVTNLDTVMITHQHSDHYGGILSVLQDLKIRKFVIDNGVENQELSQIIRERGICHRIVRRGDKIVGFPNIEIYIFHPSNSIDKYCHNNSSVVVKIVYNKISFLFTGDIENESKKELLPFREMLSSTILKVPHHGSKSSYYPRFINLVNPKIGIIQVGRNNQFNLPDEQVVKNYEEKGIKIYRTDEHNAVIITTNGEKVWVKPISISNTDSTKKNGF